MLTMQAKPRCPTATVIEACDYLGVSRTTLYGMIARGELPSLKIGGSRRVRWIDLDRLVKGGIVPADESL